MLCQQQLNNYNKGGYFDFNRFTLATHTIIRRQRIYCQFYYPYATDLSSFQCIKAA